MLILIKVFITSKRLKFNLYMYISEESSLNFDFKNIKQNCSKFFTTHPQTSEYFANLKYIYIYIWTLQFNNLESIHQITYFC